MCGSCQRTYTLSVLGYFSLKLPFPEDTLNRQILSVDLGQWGFSCLVWLVALWRSSQIWEWLWFCGNNFRKWPEWTSTHQHIIHWMPIITQLWINLNSQQKTVFSQLTIHPSCCAGGCWLLVHSGQYDWSTQAFWGFLLFPIHFPTHELHHPQKSMIPFWQTVIVYCTNWQIHSIPQVVNNTTLLDACSMVTNEGWSIPSAWIIIVLGFCSWNPTFYLSKN